MKYVNEPSDPAQAVRHYLRWSYGLTILLVFGLGGWAVATEISGAIVTSGQLVVESSVKKVQHPSGGVIGSIEVEEGRKVKAGDVVLRLDPTVARANLSIIENSLDQLAAREVRLLAERDGQAQVEPASRFRDRPSDEAAMALVRSEESLFALRRAAREGQVSQLRERILQLKDEIGGQTDQRLAKDREIELIKAELVGVHELYRKNLVPVTRVNALERDAARLAGERGLLISSTSSAKGKINEINLQILQVEQQMRTEVARDLREVQDKASELIERQVAAQDQLQRIDLRAPQDGVVHDLNVFTVGGVINPGETVMTIVPSLDSLAVDVRIMPTDISHLHPGQPVMLRLSAFNQRTTPEVEGVLVRMGADLSHDQRSGASYYTARIRLAPGQIDRLEGKALMPGMPVEAFIRTGDRSVLSYLTKPLTDQVRRAFRES